MREIKFGKWNCQGHEVAAQLFTNKEYMKRIRVKNERE